MVYEAILTFVDSLDTLEAGQRVEAYVKNGCEVIRGHDRSLAELFPP